MPRSVIQSSHCRLRHHRRESQRGLWSNWVLKSSASCLQFNYSSFYSRFSEANLSCKLKQYKIIKQLREPSLNISIENVPWGVLKDHQIREEKSLSQSPAWKTADLLSCTSSSWTCRSQQPRKSAHHISLMMLLTAVTVLKTSKTLKYNFSLLSRLMISKKTILRNERGK